VRWQALNFLPICDKRHSNILNFKLTYPAGVFRYLANNFQQDVI
jgi:hypothetical protein